MTNPNEMQLMVQVASLYYESGLTQQEIAQKLQTTRQQISRLLLAAREEGIVRISIYNPTATDTELAGQLRTTFGLDEVRLISSEGKDTDLLRSQLEMMGADVLAKNLSPGCMVGTGTGRTLYEVVNSLPRGSQIPVHVVPMMGGIGDMSPFFQVNELARRTAEAFGGTFRYIYAPAFTQDTTILQSLSRTHEVEQMINLWTHLDVAVMGIGHVEFHHISSMFFADHISADDLAELESIGAVGDLCGRFFDLMGKHVSVGPGSISIEIDQLRAIPKVIAIAGGVEKIRAISGALHTGVIKTLVTDTATAQAVLIETMKGGARI